MMVGPGNLLSSPGFMGGSSIWDTSYQAPVFGRTLRRGFTNGWTNIAKDKGDTHNFFVQWGITNQKIFGNQVRGKVLMRKKLKFGNYLSRKKLNFKEMLMSLIRIKWNGTVNVIRGVLRRGGRGLEYRPPLDQKKSMVLVGFKATPGAVAPRKEKISPSSPPDKFLNTPPGRQISYILKFKKNHEPESGNVWFDPN